MLRAIAVLLLAAFACEDPPPPPPLPPVVPPPRVPVAAPRSIATDVAYDLVMGTRGPILVWGQPTSLGGEIRALQLNATGDGVGHEKVLVAGGSVGSQIPPDAIEIVAAATGGRLGLTWVRRNQTQLDIVGSYGSETGDAMSPPVVFGETEMDRMGRRGQLAIAGGNDDAFEILYRGTRGPCAEGSDEECPHFFVRELGGDAERRGIPLAVPEPCERGVAGFAEAAGVWYYALCAVEDGVQAARIFALQFEPEYAHHEKLLEGCDPLGLAPFGDGVVVIGRCGNDVRGVHVTDAARTLANVEGAPRVVCQGATPVLQVGAASVPLRGPRDRLAALLPASVAPTDARAVWTGESVVVATGIGREVALRRFECEDGRFRRTDHE